MSLVPVVTVLPSGAYCDVSGVFQALLTNAGTFWLFASMCAVNVVFTIAFVPETKGKTLEQIQDNFRGTRAQ